MLHLRDYQKELVKSVITSLFKGNQKVLVISPTGSGKTVCFIKIAEFMVNTLKEDEAVLILSHLDLLTKQTLQKFKKFTPEIEAGILQGKDFPSKDARVIISTMQSSRVQEKLMSYEKYSGKKVKLIIVDESHRAFCESYESIYNYFPEIPSVEFTATPFKHRKLLTNQYDDVAFQITLDELIEKKYLVKPNLNKIKVKAKETPERVALFAKLYAEKEKGNGAIMFMRTKQECSILSDALRTLGIVAQPVTDEITGETRNSVFEKFENGEIDVLVSVNVLKEGFDSLRASAVFMWETKDPAIYLQIIGRVLRSQDGTGVKETDWKQSANIYLFGDSPQISTEFYEKMHENIIKPKSFKQAEDVGEALDLLELSGEGEINAEYKTYYKELFDACRTLSKLKMDKLRDRIWNMELPEDLLGKLARNHNEFKTLRTGNTLASDKQREFMDTLGFPMRESNEMSKNEASYVIDALIPESCKNKKKKKNDHMIKKGLHRDKHITKVPWAYITWCKKNPEKPTAKHVLYIWNKHKEDRKKRLAKM